MSEESRALASPKTPEPPAGHDAVREYLAFDVGGEHYALPLTCIREIVRVPPVTEVPRCPETVLGIISVRGTVTTAFDLRRKLRLPAAAPSVRSRILIIDGGHELQGLLVDEVFQVYRLREQEVELASVLGGGASSYLVGIGRPEVGGRSDMLLLLDPIALLKS